jgi:1,4-dihydroxy-2-naphthoate octaprenyltransferase
MKNFILATRPKTLLAGVVPPLVAYSYYFARTGDNQSLYLLLCVLGALLIQIATNFFNDVIDHEKGADAKRVGPTRVSAAGLVNVSTVRSWAYLCLSLAALCGVPLILRGGAPIMIMGLLSLYLTYAYTGGKVSLAYRGLGELFVFLFFGLFSVMGSYWLFALDVDFRVFNLASIFGLLTTTLICVNNLRDRESDKEVGKHTMATRTTPAVYKAFILTTIYLPYLLLLPYWGHRALPVVVLALVPAIKLGQIVLHKRGAELNEGLKFSGIHLVIFSVLLSGAFLYERLL